MPPSTLRPQLGNVNRNVAQPPVPPQTLIMNAMMQAAMLDRQHQQQQGQVGPTLGMAPPPPMVRPGFVPMTGMAPPVPPTPVPSLVPQNAPLSWLINQAVSQQSGPPNAPPMQFGPGNPTQLYGQPRPMTPIEQDALRHKQQQAALAQGTGGDDPLSNVINDPIGSLVQATTPLDEPRQWNVSEQGEIVYENVAWQRAKNVQEAISYGLIPADAEPNVAEELFKKGKDEHALAQPGLGVDMNDEDLLNKIIEAHQQGYTAYKTVNADVGGQLGTATQKPGDTKQVSVAQFDGGRAVWELLQGRKNMFGRIIGDIVYDPTTVGLGPVGKAGEAVQNVGRGLRTADDAGVVGKTVGALVEGVGAAARVPDVVLNQAPDLLIDAPIKKAAEVARSIPIVGKLFEETGRSQARHAGNVTDDALRILEGVTDAPTDMHPTSPLGGIPEPTPGQPTHALAAGEIPQPGTPPVNELAPSPHPIEVTPEGEALPTDPNYLAQGAEPPPPPVSRPGQTVPEKAPRPIETPPMRTAEDHAVALREGTARATDPVEGGPRLVDRAATIGKKTPEGLQSYQQFVQDIQPDELHASYRAWLEAPTTRFPTLEEKQARQILDGVESTVYQTAPAFQRRFPGESLDIPVTEKRKAAGTASGKASFQNENLRYLIQRAVYQDDAKALATIRGRFKGQPWVDEVTQRIEAANAEYVKLRETGPQGVQTVGSGPTPAWVADAVKREATGEMPKRTPSNLNPNPEVPQQIRDVLDTKFSGQSDPALAGVRTEDVYKANLLETQHDQQLYQDFAAKGYSPDNYKGSNPPKLTMREQRMRVKTGTTTGASGKARNTYRWQTTQVPSSEPNEAMAALRQKYIKIGKIDEMTPQELARKKTARDRVLDINPREATKPNLLTDLIDGLINRLPRNLILADPVTSYDYTMRNIIGNYSLSGIQGIAPSPGDVIRAGRRPNESIAADLEAELFGQKAKGAPAEMAHEASKLEDISRSDTPARELGKKLHVDFAAKIFDWKKGIDHVAERGHKLSTYATFYRDTVAEQIVKETDELSRYAAKRGIAVTDQEIGDALWSLRGPAGGFNQHDIYDAMYTMGQGAGLEDEAARKFARTAAGSWNKRALDARAEAVFQTNRIFPERRTTNLDRYASYLTLFHFWPTRSAKYLAEEMLRDPRLIHWWMEAHKGLARAAEEGNYPASVKGLMWLANSPFGFALYANPASLFLVTALQPEGPSYPDPQGMTQFGHIIQEIKNKSGIGPTPWLDALLNVTGVYGDTFLPNPLPTGTIPLAGAAIDALLVYTGHHPGDPIYQKAASYIRSLASGIIPGTTHVPYVNPADKRSDPIASMVLSQNPDLQQRLTDPATQADAEAELAQIMSDEEDPKYVAAERAVAGQGILTELIRTISPLSVKAKNLDRERMIENAAAVRDIPFNQRTPEQQAVIDARGFVTTTPEAMVPKSEQDQYGALGTKEQREIDRNWNMIAYGDIYDLNKALGPQGAVLDAAGNPLRYSEFVKLSKDERIAAADAYIARNKYDEGFKTINDAQKAFKESHPVYKGYSDFGKTARDYPGGIKAFREQLMRANPAYRQYIGHLAKNTRDNPRALDKASISMDAFLAARGTKASIYAPNLSQDTEGWANTELLLNALGGSNSSTKKQYDLSTPEGKLASLKDKLAKYDTDMASYSAAAMKQTGGVPFETLAPQFASVAESQLKQQGIKKPNTPEIVAAYNLWKTYQPEGADTSPEAYITFLTDYENAGKKAA